MMINILLLIEINNLGYELLIIRLFEIKLIILQWEVDEYDRIKCECKKLIWKDIK